MKFKVGGRSPEVDAERFRVAREAAGPDFALMADANQGYTLAEAVEFARRVGDLDLRWFEEPCRWTNDRRAMRDVRYMTGVPVCAGQSETTLHGLRDLVVDGAIDVSNFDASWAGGPHDLAQGRRAVRRVRGPAGAPRGAAGQLAPAGEHAGPHLHRVLRRGARPLLLAAHGHVDAASPAAATACPTGRASASTSTGTTCGHTPWTPGSARGSCGNRDAWPRAYPAAVSVSSVPCLTICASTQ